ncbi:DUF4834 family protein [Dyadobacter fanqingshengii]|uniref:DUF4834 family protein n=1 Tax=Dyadobacter fanqingshengii TaxID=2906443 RepID=A0A9X1P8Y5_9BACT|nr:DUF4834 family protein [Dyadobacter fanqingshengii]MCF0040217.1 DUF4834 family protein [Dyadobacter fanqingshengii]MCF2502295.1 DUF4834 family protein [Dyadobacter fanqingshengii]USJ38034.1 DUF4834 family protein [Dyadobacter fanqingshengii]
MKLLFNIILIFLLLIAFVPFFRRFIFHLLVGRKLIKEQERQYKAQQQRQRANAGVKVDNVPPDANQSSRFGGGEYVDYEEVK